MTNIERAQEIIRIVRLDTSTLIGKDVSSLIDEALGHAVTLANDLVMADMKQDKGPCCPACENGIHDCTESRLYHHDMKCECACNIIQPIVWYCTADCGCAGAQLAKDCKFQPSCYNCRTEL